MKLYELHQHIYNNLLNLFLTTNRVDVVSEVPYPHLFRGQFETVGQKLGHLEDRVSPAECGPVLYLSPWSVVS